MRRKLTMTNKWRASLAKARAAREAKAKERGCRYTPEGLEKMRELGANNPASWEASRARKALEPKRVSIEAEPLVWELVRLLEGQPALFTEIAKRAGTNTRTLSGWRAGEQMPRLDTFRRVAWECGYDVKLIKRDQRPRDKSIWLAPRERFNAPSG